MYAVTDRIADLSMIWKQVSLVFPYFDQTNTDWDDLYRAYIPKVLRAENALDYHLLLAEFVNTLGDGHTDYSLPQAMQADRGYLPFSLRLIENAYCINAAIPGFEKFLYQPVLSVNHVPFDEIIRLLSRYSYHVGQFIPAWRLRSLLPFFFKPRGNTLETESGAFSFDLLPDKPVFAPVQPLQPAFSCQEIAQKPVEMRLYNNCVLYVALDDFLNKHAAEALLQAFRQFPDLAGLILDLRENIGGMTLRGAEIAKLLISGEFFACSKHTRSMTGVGLASASQLIRWSKEAIDAHIAAGHATREEIDESLSYAVNAHCDRYTDTYGAKDHKALYQGPCILLTSRHTVSAAEDFAAMFRTNHRALILGQPTCGTTGTPLLQTLSCGGRLRVCSVGYRLLDGTAFIGSGIAPDVLCENTLEDHKCGHDRVLDEALKRLTAS